jgi:hypothetical protein
MPTPFQAGYQLACEEILHRLRTEEWELCVNPVGAGMEALGMQAYPGAHRSPR